MTLLNYWFGNSKKTWDTYTSAYNYNLDLYNATTLPSEHRAFNIINLDTNKFVAVSQGVNNTSLFARIITISGDTLVSGTAVTLATNLDSGDPPWQTGHQFVAKIATDKFIVVWERSSDVTYRICTVSGDTITMGNATVLHASYYSMPSVVYNSGYVIIADKYESGIVKTTNAYSYTVSGTTLSAEISTVKLNGDYRQYIYMSQVPDSSTRFLCSYTDDGDVGDYEARTIYLNTSTGALSVGAQVEVGTALNARGMSSVMVNGTQGLICHSDSATNLVKSKFMGVSGSTITVGSSTDIISTTEPILSYDNGMVILKNDTSTRIGIVGFDTVDYLMKLYVYEYTTTPSLTLVNTITVSPSGRWRFQSARGARIAMNADNSSAVILQYTETSGPLYHATATLLKL